jgi:hypothetical protein
MKLHFNVQGTTLVEMSYKKAAISSYVGLVYLVVLDSSPVDMWTIESATALGC